MRLLECLNLRVKDIDLGRNEATVRDGKGSKDRVTTLPASIKPALQEHLAKVRRLHENDIRSGLGRAPLPCALTRKYPKADREWGWQFVFPASGHHIDRDTGVRHRHHLHESVIQKSVGAAARQGRRPKLHVAFRWGATVAPPQGKQPARSSAAPKLGRPGGGASRPQPRAGGPLSGSTPAPPAPEPATPTGRASAGPQTSNKPASQE